MSANGVGDNAHSLCRREHTYKTSADVRKMGKSTCCTRLDDINTNVINTGIDLPLNEF